MAACGIAPEDDDANHAVKSTQAPQVKATPKPAPQSQVNVKADVGTQENIQAQTTPAVHPQPVHNNVDSNIPPAPPKMQGKADQWQLKVSTEPGTDFAQWAEMVKDATVFMLEMAQTKDDTMNIFRTNRNIYDKLQADDLASYDALTNIFKTYKEKL
jgi:hypothetical protein